MNNLSLNVNLDFQQLVEVVKQLTPKEKLMLSNVIWDENMPISLEQQTLVLERISSAKKNPERMLDWDEASKTLVQ